MKKKYGEKKQKESKEKIPIALRSRMKIKKKLHIQSC